MRWPICVSVALVLSGCRPAESTTAPAAEVQRSAELGGVYVAADDRQQAAAAEIERAEAAEAEARARVQAESEREAADAAELARLRRELTAASQWVQASRAAHDHAREEAEAVATQLRQVEGRRLGDVAYAKERDLRKYTRMTYSSIPVNLGGVAFLLVGVFSLEARQSIADGKRPFDSAGEREAALQRTTRNTILGYAVGLPLAAAGLTLFVVGRRGINRVERLTVSPGGIGFRF